MKLYAAILFSAVLLTAALALTAYAGPKGWRNQQDTGVPTTIGGSGEATILVGDSSAAWAEIKTIGGTGPSFWCIAGSCSISGDGGVASGVLGLLSVSELWVSEGANIGKILPPTTSDPCTGQLDGAAFYNKTNNYYCFCLSEAAKQMHSPASACAF